MTITLYHASYSRSVRVRWLLEEMGLDYQLERVELDHATGKSGGEAYAAVNPLHKVPALKDGDQTLIESVAILQYLMGKYGPTDLDVTPDEPGYADYLQFLHFGESGLGMYVTMLMAHTVLLPEDRRSEGMAKWARDETKKALAFPEAALSDRDYLAAGRFTAADISVIYMLLLLKLVKAFDDVAGPNLKTYWKRITARKAWSAASAD